MYKREFEQLLKSGTNLPRNIMFFGDDEYHIEKFTDTILNRAGNPSLLKLYFNEFDLQMAKTHLGESSLFGDSNILVVKTDKKIDTKSLKALIETVNKTPSSMFIIHYLAEDGKNKAKTFNKKGESANVRFFKPNFSEGMGTLTEIAREKGLDLSPDIISHLLTRHSLNIALAVSDLSKFELYKEKVTINDANKLISGEQEADIYDLVEAIILKQDFTRIVGRILADGENETTIITSLNNTFSQLFTFNASIKINGFINSLEILGYKLPQQIEQKRGNLAIKIRTESYLPILKTILRGELILKSDSKAEKKAILLSTLIKIQELV